MYGQLGDGTQQNQSLPTNIEALQNQRVKVIDGSKFSSAIITHSNKLYTWGSAKSGTLGKNFHIQSHTEKTPSEVDLVDGVVLQDMSMGNHHMGVVTEEGELFTWGFYNNAQLGHSQELLEQKLDLHKTTVRSSIEQIVKRPTKVVGVKDAKKILCKYKNTFYINRNGKLFVVGSTEKGVNGNGRKRENISSFEEIKIEGEPELVDIRGGNSFCIALDKQGRLYSWGYNNYGQLGNEDQLIQYQPKQVHSLLHTKIKKVACGEYFVLALDEKGKVFSWGNGNFGQLGHGTKEDLKQPTLLKFDQKIVDISCGDSHSAILTESGEVFCFGNGKDGLIGRGDQIESSSSYRTSPMKVTFFEKQGLFVDQIGCGGYHTFAEALLF